METGGSMLSNFDIERAIANKWIIVDPYAAKLMQPASLDVRLDCKFRVFNNHLYTHIDPSIEQVDLTTEVTIEKDQPFILHPGEFVLASTYEVIGVPNIIAARLEGKSSLGRLGLVVHSTAGFVDPGFRGHITLELSNVANLPIKLWYGMKIGQLCFFRLYSAPTMSYGDAKLGSRYQEQRGPTPSRSYQNWTTDL